MKRNRSDQKARRKPSGAAVPRVELTQALYRALFEEWAERGFSAISLERVAARAGAGKAAIYRRWSSRYAFAEEAVSSLGLAMALTEDHGDLRQDILAFLLRLRAVLRHPLIRRILPDLHAEALRSPEMRAINSRVAEARRAQGRGLIDRAVERGELSRNVDYALALDLLPAPLYWRMTVIGETPTRAQLMRQVAAITAGLSALEGSREEN